MKRCHSCKTEKSRDEFCKNKRKKDGTNTVCRACTKVQSKLWRTTNKDKYKAYNDKHYQEKREYYLSKSRAEYHANPEKRRGYQLARYWPGTTWDWALSKFREMCASQNNKCAVCQKEATLCVDHNHTTGEVRALLCNTCNLAAGYIYDDSNLASELSSYLKKFGT